MDSPLSIAIATTNYPPKLGGVGSYVKGLASILQSQGHEVVVFTTSIGSDDDGGPEVRRDSSLLRLARRLGENTFDIVHLNGLENQLTDVLIALHGDGLVHSVLTPHAVFPPRSPVWALLKSLHHSSIGKTTLARVARVIALTEENGNQLISLGCPPRKVRVVPNCIQAREFAKPPDPELAHECLGDDFFLVAGRPAWHKGIPELFKVLCELDSVSRVVFTGFSPGSAKHLVDSVRILGLEDSVQFAGYLERDVLLSAMRHATAVLLPSLWEGLPSVLLEAMASGGLVIVSSTASQGVVEHSVSGVVVDFSSVAEVKVALEVAMQNDQRALRDRARKVAMTEYSWESNVQRIEEVYNEAAPV